MIMYLLILSASSATSASATRLARSYTGDQRNSGLIFRKHSTPMTVKVSFLRPRTHNRTREALGNRDYLFSTLAPSTSNPLNHSSTPPGPVVPKTSGKGTSILAPVPVPGNGSNPTNPPQTDRSKNVNLAVIPVLGIFFLMVIVCFKGCSWFREHLKEHDIEDDGKEYVILSPPEEGYREVEFRSDTSSMYYDTVSSYRSILKQKGEYGGYNNYDTVTSIRSYLQRADVRDAAVQVRFLSQRPDRWKSVSGILSNSTGGGSHQDLLRVPTKKSHRQVSFQTNQNESYEPPSPRTRDVNIQVGISTMDRWKQGKFPQFQNGVLPRHLSPGHGSRGCLVAAAAAIPNRHSSASLRSMDQTDNHPLKRTESTGCASAMNDPIATEAEPGVVTAKPKARRAHHFEVLRVNSSDRLGSHDTELIHPPPIQATMITSNYVNDNQSLPGLSAEKSDRSETGAASQGGSGDQGEMNEGQTSSVCHPQFHCDQFAQTDSDSANEAMSPATAAAHTRFSPPILTDVKIRITLSDDEEDDEEEEEEEEEEGYQEEEEEEEGYQEEEEEEEEEYLEEAESDELNSSKKVERDSLLEELYIGESSDTADEGSMVTSGQNSLSWSEQMDNEESQLEKLLQAHASTIAGAPIASPVSMDSNSSCQSSMDDVAQRVDLHAQSANEAGTTASDDSGEGRTGVERSIDPVISQGSQSVSRNEETGLMEHSLTDPASSPRLQSPASGILAGGRPYRVSSGYDTQGPESSSIRGVAEAGADTSCNVTPLTSSNNSLQECGREPGKAFIHSQPPLQQLIFQHLQQDERNPLQKQTELKPRQTSQLSKDKTSDSSQPLSYIPKTDALTDPPFHSQPKPSQSRHSLASTDSTKSSNASIENIPQISTGSTPPTPTDYRGPERPGTIVSPVTTVGPILTTVRKSAAGISAAVSEASSGTRSTAEK